MANQQIDKIEDINEAINPITPPIDGQEGLEMLGHNRNQSVILSRFSRSFFKIYSHLIAIYSSIKSLGQNKLDKGNYTKTAQDLKNDIDDRIPYYSSTKIVGIHYNPNVGLHWYPNVSTAYKFWDSNNFNPDEKLDRGGLTGTALELKNWLVSNYTTLMNNIKATLDNDIATKLPHGGYSKTALELFNTKKERFGNGFSDLGIKSINDITGLTNDMNADMYKLLTTIVNKGILKCGDVFEVFIHTTHWANIFFPMVNCNVIIRAFKDSLYEVECFTYTDSTVKYYYNFNHTAGASEWKVQTLDSVTSKNTLIAASANSVRIAHEMGANAKVIAENHIAKKDNPHGVTKAQIGLPNVQNRAFFWEEGGGTPLYLWGSIGSEMNQYVFSGAQVKNFIGLNNISNFPITSSVTDSSNEKYATAGAVKSANDNANTRVRKLSNVSALGISNADLDFLNASDSSYAMHQFCGYLNARELILIGETLIFQTNQMPNLQKLSNVGSSNMIEITKVTSGVFRCENYLYSNINSKYELICHVNSESVLHSVNSSIWRSSFINRNIFKGKSQTVSLSSEINKGGSKFLVHYIVHASGRLGTINTVILDLGILNFEGQTTIRIAQEWFNNTNSFLSYDASTYTITAGADGVVPEKQYITGVSVIG